MIEDNIPKVAVGVPCMGDVRIETTMSLMAMVGNSPNVKFDLIPKVGCYIHMNRENIVLDAQKDEASHLLFVDSDMEFAPDSLMKLLEMNKPIIGADYNFKLSPPRSVTILDNTLFPKELRSKIAEKVRNIPSEKEIAFRPIYKDILLLEDEIEVEENSATAVSILVQVPRIPQKCRAIGTGFTLIQMWVFDKILRPWFFFRPEKFHGIHFGSIGEDVWFCDAARTNGIEVWYDPTIEIRHVGVGYY